MPRRKHYSLDQLSDVKMSEEEEAADRLKYCGVMPPDWEPPKEWGKPMTLKVKYRRDKFESELLAFRDHIVRRALK